MKTAIISFHAFDLGCSPSLNLSDHRDETPILFSGLVASLVDTNGDLKGA